MSARDEALRIALASRGVASPEEVVAALTGPKGDIGPEGPQGIEGPVGPEGPEGPKGDDGIRGPQGVQGPKGDKGDRGAKGTKGDKGPMGPMGPQGWPGGGGGGSGGSGSALTVKDETVSLDAAVTSIDFVGAGVTATNVGHAITVEIDGGAGSTNVYVQDSDPGAVGAGKLWVDTTTPGTTDQHVWKRNAADDGWEDLLANYLSGADISLVNVTEDAGVQTSGPTLTFFAGDTEVTITDEHAVIQSAALELSIAGDTGTDGQVLTAQGDGTALWEDGAGGTPAVDPGDIADPTIATAEDVALKLNALMAAMRTAGSLA